MKHSASIPKVVLSNEESKRRRIKLNIRSNFSFFLGNTRTGLSRWINCPNIKSYSSVIGTYFLVIDVLCKFYIQITRGKTTKNGKVQVHGKYTKRKQKKKIKQTIEGKIKRKEITDKPKSLTNMRKRKNKVKNSSTHITISGMIAIILSPATRCIGSHKCQTNKNM